MRRSSCLQCLDAMRASDRRLYSISADWLALRHRTSLPLPGSGSSFRIFRVVAHPPRPAITTYRGTLTYLMEASCCFEEAAAFRELWRAQFGSGGRCGSSVRLRVRSTPSAPSCLLAAAEHVQFCHCSIPSTDADCNCDPSVRLAAFRASRSCPCSPTPSNMPAWNFDADSVTDCPDGQVRDWPPAEVLRTRRFRDHCEQHHRFGPHLCGWQGGSVH
jgi:hypothetical protein